MPHVSQRKLNTKIEKEIKRLLIKTIGDLKNKEDFENFFEAFFSETEQIMFSKRFLIYYFLEKGNGVEEIAESLKVSPATVVRLNLKRKLNHEKFLAAFKKIDKTFLKESLKELAKEIGLKLATQIARGGRFKTPSPY